MIVFNLEYVPDLALQVSLDGDVEVPLIIAGYPVHRVELASENRNYIETVLGCVTKEFAVAAIGDVKDAVCIPDRLGRESLLIFYHAMKLFIRRKQIEDIVLIVADVNIAFVIIVYHANVF